ncbi:MAG: tRNA lysidine(34) synthetase TilS [Oscillospiraceae bacterium]|nr:tRNA lysidine(34) synthetase TilS [Oscillospiraceae bacterium]
MINKVDELLSANNFSFHNKNIVLAVSGGMDSMSMLFFFCKNKDYYKIKGITVAHFNHNLRAIESDEDEAAVRDLSEILGVKLITENGNMDRLPKPKGYGTESWARELRYEFLKRTAEDCSGYILTAHTKNDSAETVLFNLIRGTKFRGLSGIPFQYDNIIRPFLNISRSEIEQYITLHDIPYRTDLSNLTDDFSRNKIRNHIIPLLETINSKTTEHILEFAEFSRYTDSYLTAISQNILKQARTKTGDYSLNHITSCDSLVKRYVLRAILEENHIETYSANLISLMMDVVDSKLTSVEISKDTYFTRDDTTVGIKSKNTTGIIPFRIAADVGIHQLILGVVEIERYELSEQLQQLSGTSQNTLDCDKIKERMYLRSREPSDTFTSMIRGQTKSIKKLFNERMIPVEMRSQIPLLADDDGIVWIPGEGIAKRVAVDSETKSVYIISFKEVYDGK